MSKRKVPVNIPSQTGGAAAVEADIQIQDAATVQDAFAKRQCPFADGDEDNSPPPSPFAQRPPGIYPATPVASEHPALQAAISRQLRSNHHRKDAQCPKAVLQTFFFKPLGEDKRARLAQKCRYVSCKRNTAQRHKLTQHRISRAI